MNEENSKRIVKEFPEIFQPSENSPFSWFGFECGDGWVELLVECVMELKEVCIRSKAINLRVAQIKEKFGTLRFYIDGVGWEEDGVHGAIRRAELRSAKTCEICGEEGEINRGPWYAVRCEKCRRGEEGK